MTTEQLIAEITSGGFQQYEEAGLIDHISLRTWIKNELKRFGGNLTQRNEVILHVKDSKAKLPDNFWQLYMAVECEIETFESNDPEKILQNSFFFRERVEGIQEWNNGNESYENTTYKYLREDFYFNKAKATFYYSNPTYLRLVKGFNKSLCNSECPNIRSAVVRNSIHEINIKSDWLYANFKEGTIYMQYDGLAMDEDNQVIIPETQHNRLKEYLLYYCRMRVLEDLIIGDDDPSKLNMLNYFAGKTDVAFMLAMTEVKMEALGKDWMRVLRNKQRAQTLKYDLMLPMK